MASLSLSPSTTLISSLFLLLILLSAGGVNSSSRLIRQACRDSNKQNHKIKQNFCENALQAAPASLCANISRLGLIAITLLKNNVTDTKCYIRSILLSGYQQSKIEALDNCMQLYTQSIAISEAAEDDYEANRLTGAKSKVTDVIENAMKCHKGFHNAGSHDPVKRHNLYAYQLGSMALAIMKMRRDFPMQESQGAKSI